MPNELTKIAFKQGMRAAWPGVVGTGAWGLVTGIAMVKMGLSVPLAIGMTVFVYAGSAQLAVTPLIVAHVPLGIVLLTAAIVNLRFVIYSALLLPLFRENTFFRRMMLGYITTDLAMAIFIERQNRNELPKGFEGFFCGIAILNWFFWESASFLGIALAQHIPSEWALDFAGTLALIALVTPMLNTKPALGGALIAAAVSVLGYELPFKLGLVVAVIAGLVAAMYIETRSKRISQERA